MKQITAEELRDSLTFNETLNTMDENSDNEEIIVKQGDPLFEECFENWMSNRVCEEWITDELVECFPEDSDEPFCMTLEEYRKI